MTNLADLVENDIANYWLSSSAMVFTRPTIWHASLHNAAGQSSAETNAAFTATEFASSVGAYARVQITSWSSNGSGAVANNASASFPLATAAWGSANALGIWGGGTTLPGSGNLIFWVNITQVAVSSNDTVTIGASAITLTIT